MRGPEDLVRVKVTLSSIVSLDRERIVEDPAWAAIADNVDLNDPEQVEKALAKYLNSYLQRQMLFGGQDVFMPSTNGPASLEMISAETIQPEKEVGIAKQANSNTDSTVIRMEEIHGNSNGSRTSTGSGNQ